MIYAGFWRRAIALFVDMIIMVAGVFLLALPQLVSQVILYVQTQKVTFSTGLELAFEQMVYLMDSMLVIDDQFNPQMFTFSILWAVIFTIFFSLLESSKWQATPGKKLMGIYVCDLNEERLDFAQSFMRNFNKIFSMLTFNIGFILAGLTRKRQALHDIMSQCLVMKVARKG